MSKLKQFLNDIICACFGHKFVLLRKITDLVREIRCARCGKEFGMNDSVEALLPLDENLRSEHNSIKE